MSHRESTHSESTRREPALYQTDAIVGPRGELRLDGMPFEPDQAVDVVVVPSRYREICRRLLDLCLRAADPATTWRWGEARVPAAPRRFEDLLFLFELSPLNRGLVRLDLDEAGAVFTAIASLPAPRGIEIGRFKGGSTFLLAVAVGADGRLDSIDIAPQDDEALGEALERAHLRERVNLIVGDAPAVEGSYDFAFIDGDHSYDASRRDHNRWGARVRPGGLIIHHDMAHGRRFATQLDDLARLRSDILRSQDAELELIQETASIAIFRRTATPWTGVHGTNVE